jgi:hypothetical protein
MTNNKQQTAVEWFLIECGKYGDTAQIPDEVIEQAKAIDKGQRQHTFEQSRLRNKFIGLKYESFEQYYNETYGGGEQ